MDLQQKAIDLVNERFASEVVGQSEFVGQKWLVVRPQRIAPILKSLRDELGFDMLLDITVVDYLGKEGMPERFCVVYQIYSTKNNGNFRVKAFVPESEPVIDTVSGLWKAAMWGEREAYDMFGVRFNGHPDLRRLLMPYDYQGHPLRKDYPLRGRGERNNFPRFQK